MLKMIMEITLLIMEKSWKNHGILFLNFCGNPAKSVCRPSVRLSVCPSVTFLVIVSSPKPLDVATSNFVGA